MLPRHERALAASAGVSVAALREALRALEADETLTRLDWRDGLSYRVFVLMDHPDAPAFLRHVRRASSAGFAGARGGA